MPGYTSAYPAICRLSNPAAGWNILYMSAAGVHERMHGKEIEEELKSYNIDIFFLDLIYNRKYRVVLLC